MVSEARPEPTDPKMKLESRTAIAAFESGYAIVMRNGPSTAGIGGSVPRVGCCPGCSSPGVR